MSNTGARVLEGRKPLAVLLREEMDRTKMTDKEVESQHGLPAGVVRSLVRGERTATERELKVLRKAFPRLRHFVIADSAPEPEVLSRRRVVGGLSASGGLAAETPPPPPALAPTPIQPRAKVTSLPVSRPPTPPPPPRATSAIELRAGAPTPSSAPEIESQECASPLLVTSSSPEQYTRVEAIDPSLAALLLTGNVRNRKISKGHVDALVRDMLTGGWRLTHQGIALDRVGRLLDGQHRLSAIVKSGCTIQMSVTYNADPEAFRAVDVGHRSRTVADVYGMANGARYATLITASLRTMGMLTGAIPLHAGRLTYGEIAAVGQRFGTDVQEVVEQMSSVGGKMRVAGVVAGLAYAWPADKDGITLFVQTVLSRQGMTSPMVALWKAVERKSYSDSERRVELAEITLRCLTASLKGESLAKAYVTTAGGMAAHETPIFRHWRLRREKLGLATE